jgi:hypothetical protein
MFTEDHKEIASGKKLDDEGYMTRLELDNIEQSIKRLKKVIKSPQQQLPAWVQSKITKASDYIETAAGYLSSDEKVEESYTPLTKRILEEMGCDCDLKPASTVEKIAKKHGKSSKMIQKQLEHGIKIEKEHTTDANEARTIALQHLAERPDYYTRLMKVEAFKDPCWKGYEMVGMKKKKGRKVPNCVKINESVRIQSQSGQLMNILINWRNKNIVTQLFFPQIKIPKRREILAAIEKVYPGAKVITFRVSQIDPNLPLIQTVKEDLDIPTDLTQSILNEFKSPAWTRKEGKNQEGGLNEKGRRAYERENPGSDLKAPSKKVGNKRRKKFCSRMKGMKEKLTSAKTARDPNSRINKSLRAWNC